MQSGADQSKAVLSVANLREWEKRSFHGETAYTVEKVDGKSVVRAESSSAASGYYRKLSLKATDHPVMGWSWKISRTISAENPYLKSGDDYAARIYLVFPGRFFWQHRALVYVWSDKLPVNAMIQSPYSDRIAIIAVESGNRFAGEWKHESRNYVDDYRRYFHAEQDDPVAVAFMTDTDDTASQTVSWYGDILFSR